LAADLAPDKKFRSRVRERFERSFSKSFFVRTYLDGDRARAEEIGVPLTVADRARAVAVGFLVAARLIAYEIAIKIPGIRDRADRRLVRKLTRVLDQLGHAEFTTDASAYRGEAATASRP
jgi:hypothetical protein